MEVNLVLLNALLLSQQLPCCSSIAHASNPILVVCLLFVFHFTTGRPSVDIGPLCNALCALDDGGEAVVSLSPAEANSGKDRVPSAPNFAKCKLHTTYTACINVHL